MAIRLEEASRDEAAAQDQLNSMARSIGCDPDVVAARLRYGKVADLGIRSGNREQVLADYHQTLVTALVGAVEALPDGQAGGSLVRQAVAQERQRLVDVRHDVWENRLDDAERKNQELPRLRRARLRVAHRLRQISPLRNAVKLMGEPNWDDELYSRAIPSLPTRLSEEDIDQAVRHILGMPQPHSPEPIVDEEPKTKEPRAVRKQCEHRLKRPLRAGAVASVAILGAAGLFAMDDNRSEERLLEGGERIERVSNFEAQQQLARVSVVEQRRAEKAAAVEQFCRLNGINEEDMSARDAQLIQAGKGELVLKRMSATAAAKSKNEWQPVKGAPDDVSAQKSSNGDYRFVANPDTDTTNSISGIVTQAAILELGHKPTKKQSRQLGVFVASIVKQRAELGAFLNANEVVNLKGSELNKYLST